MAGSSYLKVMPSDVNNTAAMKKPAAADPRHQVPGSVMKKPAAAAPRDQVPGIVPLTEAALMQLDEKPNDQIQLFLNKLSSNDQQRLWKKYEAQRKMDGDDAEYKAITQGVGMKKKANASLVAFIKGGLSTKGSTWKECVTSYSSEHKSEKIMEWKSLSEAVVIWGKQELMARVLTKSIIARKNPADERFPQFLDCKDKETFAQSKKDEQQGGTKTNSSADEFLNLHNMANDGQMLKFSAEAGPEKENAEDLAKLFLKAGKHAGKGPEDDGASHGNESVPSHVIAQHLGDLETASAIGGGMVTPKVKTTMAAVKGILQKMTDALEKHADKDQAKKHKKVIAIHLKAFEKLKSSTKVGVIKKAVKAAANDAKKMDKFINTISG